MESFKLHIQKGTFCSAKGNAQAATNKVVGFATRKCVQIKRQGSPSAVYTSIFTQMRATTAEAAEQESPAVQEENEAFAEQLRERRRLFVEKKKPLDFWLVSEPAWLEARFPEQAKKVGRPCVALVSTDEIWMNFMKLRLDRVLRLELGLQRLTDVLKSNGPVPKYEALDKKGKWTAPYPPYRPGWWEVFMRGS